MREAENVSRFEASRSHGMTPFVGREHEVALLLDRWRDATEGEGQVALLSGEAGIGKSRILATLRERIGDAAACDDPLSMLAAPRQRRVLSDRQPNRHAAGFVGGESAAARLDKLEAMMARSAVESKEVAALLAALLSIPFEGRYPALEMAPSEQKERTIARAGRAVRRIDQGRPASGAAGGRPLDRPDVARRLQPARRPAARAGERLLVVTFRPEFAAPWVGRANVELLSLSRFGRRQALAMIDRVAGGKPLPAEVLEQIVAQDRRRAVVRGGTDQDGAGVRPAARRERVLRPRCGADPARDPLDLAGLADGAAGSPRAGQGDRPDRRGDRARVLVSPARSGFANPGAGDCRTPSASSWRRS